MLARRRRRRRLLAVLTGALAALLASASAAPAATGTDSFQSAPRLLFSVPGAVASNLSYTTQGALEPAASTGTPPPACPEMFRTAWWTIIGTGQQIDLTTAGSTFNTTMAVYDNGGGDPLAGNRKACDEDSGPGTAAALSFTFVRGRQYLVQVGGNLSGAFGAISLSASSPVRPANDDRINAQTLTTGTVANVSNAGASQEIGETQTCLTATYAATMWFRWTAPAIGDATFSTSAAFGDTAVNVIRAGDGAALACGVATAPKVTLRVAPGDYLLQVATKGSDVSGLGTGSIATKVDFTTDLDVDNDGELASTDCNDNEASIRHGVVDIPDDGIDQDCSGADAVNLDRDGDGENRPDDCNDNNPAIRHGVVDVPDDGIDQDCDNADAVNLDRDGDGEKRPDDCNDSNPAIKHAAIDVPGNAIDEDCTNGPAPFPRLESTVRTSWRFKPFRLTTLAILRPVPGSTVELRCAGGKAKGCPLKRSVVNVSKSGASLTVLSKKLKRARLKKGAVLEVRITKPGHVGFMRRHSVRVGKTGSTDPKLDDLCLPVGGGAPTPC